MPIWNFYYLNKEFYICIINWIFILSSLYCSQIFESTSEKIFFPDVIITLRCTSRNSICGVSLRVDGLVCCAPPYLEAKCCRGLWPTHIIFLSRTAWPRWRSVGLALSGSSTAEYAVIKYAACVRPPPYGHLNEKRQYPAQTFCQRIFLLFLLHSLLHEVNILMENYSAQ